MISSWPVNPPNSPFYNPQYNYGWGNTTPQWQDQVGNVGHIYGEQEKDASWTSRLAQLGMSGTDPRSQFARSQFGRAQEGYGAAKMQNLSLNWQDYLKTLDLDRLWNEQSPTMRGQNDAQYAPAVRWQMRP